MDESDVAHKLASAQLQHIQLENDKLTHELSKQRQKPAWYYFPIQLVPLITALLSVAGFLWGVVLYTNEQAKNRVEHEKQSLREKETAEREFMRPWLESQRTIYLEALNAVTAASNSREPKERATAEQQFWQLYHGRMILVETKTVSDAMVYFGRCLDRTNVCDLDEMNKRAKALASRMAESMAVTARMSYQEFAQNQFRYAPGSRN